jgi:hypothetical protein
MEFRERLFANNFHFDITIIATSPLLFMSKSLSSWFVGRDSQRSLESEDAETSPSGSSSETGEDDDVNMDARSFSMDGSSSSESPSPSAQIQYHFDLDAPSSQEDTDDIGIGAPLSRQDQEQGSETALKKMDDTPVLETQKFDITSRTTPQEDIGKEGFTQPEEAELLAGNPLADQENIGVDVPPPAEAGGGTFPLR